jgi:4-amino-4-deoxy-L-arabinose transferase-like glycosyltransferase
VSPWPTLVGHTARWQRLPTVGGLTVWVFAAAVAVEGQSLAISAQPENARRWLIAAAVLGYVGIRLLEVGQPANEAAGKCVEWLLLPRRRRLGGPALLALGGLYSALATVLLMMGVSATSVTWLWLMGLTSAVVGATLVNRRPMALRLPWQLGRARLAELGILLVVVAAAVWLRVPNLAATPPNVHGDEAAIGLEARRMLAGQLPTVFAIGRSQFPALGYASHAATMLLFGDGLLGLRTASAVEGVLSVVLLYLLVRRLWASRPALLAAAFMAVGAWHIHFSRTGFLNIQSALAILLVLYFVVRGVQERRTLDWLLCGFAIGVSIEVYSAARLAPIVAAIYLAFRAVTERGFIRTHIPGLIVAAFGAIVFLAPMAAVYARDPASFGVHMSSIMITSPSNLLHELDAYHVNTFQEVLAIQVQHTLEAFNFGGETSLEYGHPGPLFDFWTDALLAMGAIAILLRFGSARGILLASWVWLALILGSVLTTDAFFSPHLVVAIPGLMLAPALVLDRAWLGVTALAGRVGTYVFAVPVAVLLGLALQGNVHDYFDIQVVERQPAGRFTLLANYAGSINASYRLYVIGRDDFTLDYDTPRFLVPLPDAIDIRSAPLALPLDRIPANKGVAFLVENSADDFAQRINAIRRAYPDGRAENITERPGGPPTFTSYLVENSALSAANPAATRD